MTEATHGLQLRLLSLDGGGFRGLSSLQILSRIMHRIKFDQRLAVTPRPCDYFDLIGGTSTGGIIALMLGRLRMSIDDAITAYVTLGKTVFGQKQEPWKDGKFSAKALEAAIKHIIDQEYQKRQKENGFREEEFSEDLKDPLAEQYMCRTFVCAVPASHPSGAGGPTLLRTYESRDSEDLRCNICEAARATSAAPSFFSAIQVGPLRRTFIDAGLGYNNPARVLLDEAERIWNSQLDPRSLTIISIGTGHPLNSPLKPPGLLPKLFGRYDVIKTLKAISTECETTAESTERDCMRTGYTYFRFNVRDGLETIGLQEWNKQDEILASTDNYLRLNDVNRRIDASIERLKTQNLDEDISEADYPGINGLNDPAGVFSVKHDENHAFVGREEILSKLNSYLMNDHGFNPSRRVVLYGLGGVGKTQIAIRQAYNHRSRLPTATIAWINARSETTLAASFAPTSDLALRLQTQLKKSLVTETDIALWFETHADWLLIFDDGDDIFAGNDDSTEPVPTDSFRNIQRYLPRNAKGGVIITTRDSRAVSRIPGAQCLKVDILDHHSATSLFLQRARLKNPTSQEAQKVKDIVETLQYLPLAVDVAAAYLVENPSITLDTYHSWLMEDPQDHHLNRIMTADLGLPFYSRPVFRCWEITLRQIEREKPNATILLFMSSFYDPDWLFIDILFRDSDLTLSDMPSGYMPPSEFAMFRKGSEYLFEEALSTLIRFSLVRLSRGVFGHLREMAIHSLVHLWARKRMESQATSLYLCLSAHRLGLTLTVPHRTRLDTILGPVTYVFGHVERCLSHLFDFRNLLTLYEVPFEVLMLLISSLCWDYSVLGIAARKEEFNNLAINLSSVTLLRSYVKTHCSPVHLQLKYNKFSDVSEYLVRDERTRLAIPLLFRAARAYPLVLRLPITEDSTKSFAESFKSNEQVSAILQLAQSYPRVFHLVMPLLQNLMPAVSKQMGDDAQCLQLYQLASELIDQQAGLDEILTTSNYQVVHWRVLLEALISEKKANTQSIETTLSIVLLHFRTLQGRKVKSKLADFLTTAISFLNLKTPDIHKKITAIASVLYAVLSMHRRTGMPPQSIFICSSTGEIHPEEPEIPWDKNLCLQPMQTIATLAHLQSEDYPRRVLSLAFITYIIRRCSVLEIRRLLPEDISAIHQMVQWSRQHNSRQQATSAGPEHLDSVFVWRILEAACSAALALHYGQESQGFDSYSLEHAFNSILQFDAESTFLGILRGDTLFAANDMPIGMVQHIPRGVIDILRKWSTLAELSERLDEFNTSLETLRKTAFSPMLLITFDERLARRNYAVCLQSLFDILGPHLGQLGEAIELEDDRLTKSGMQSMAANAVGSFFRFLSQPGENQDNIGEFFSSLRSLQGSP